MDLGGRQAYRAECVFRAPGPVVSSHCVVLKEIPDQHIITGDRIKYDALVAPSLWLNSALVLASPSKLRACPFLGPKERCTKRVRDEYLSGDETVELS